MNKKFFSYFVRWDARLALLAVLLALVCYTPSAASAVTASTPTDDLFNADGTLNLAAGFNGMLDLHGWQVTLDEERGPIFHPAGHSPAETNEYDWWPLGTGIDGNVWQIAIIGSDVYAAGQFWGIGSNCDSAAGCIYIAKWNGSAWLLLGTGTGTLDNKYVYDILISSTDVNASGMFEKAGNCMNDCLHITRYEGMDQMDGQLAFMPRVNYSAGDEPVSIAIADFNADSKLDLTVAAYRSDAVLILLGNGDGSFNSAVSYTVGDGPNTIASGDFNADNKFDLATANRNSENVSILLGVGNGTFNAVVNYTAGNDPVWILTEDFNEDNKLDLALANNNSDDVSILLGVGNGTFGSPDNFNVGSSPWSVVAGDFNDDDHLDLATANNNSNDVSVLLGAGDGTFGSAENYSAGSMPCGPAAVTTADFDGDDHLDLATANYYGSDLSVLMGVGDGTFEAAVRLDAGNSPFAITSGDFDGDENEDLAAANRYSDNVSILLGNGDGTFDEPANFVVGDEPVGITAALLNADTKPDLVTANGYSDNVSILINFTQQFNVFLPLVVRAP